MKTITAIIERNEDAYFAYVDQIDGCVAGGNNFIEVKANLSEMIKLSMEEDPILHTKFAKGYEIKFEVDLESVFKLVPEINVTQLAKLGKLNSGLLRQYVSGAKKASENQAEKVMNAIEKLADKLNSLKVTA